jgi:hypothetical protein
LKEADGRREIPLANAASCGIPCDPGNLALNCFAGEKIRFVWRLRREAVAAVFPAVGSHLSHMQKAATPIHT